MQLASHGARVAPRNASNFIPRNPLSSNSSRSLHIPSYARFPRRLPAHGSAQQVFTFTRTLLGRFFSQLTAPGLRAPVAPSVARSLHGSAGRTTIHQGLSFPVRTTLSRPMHSPFLPRGPNVASRSVAQVGLGTARNFSSTRPIFQNLVENVPIAGRAFYEADWETKVRQEREAARKPLKNASEKSRSKEMMKPKLQDVISIKEGPVHETTSYEAEMEHYFPSATTPNVTTYLLIPLAPTPTARVPLSADSSAPHLLPLPTLASIHSSHTTHSLRVSSLFARLDAANVWERNVLCSAYSHGAHLGGEDGACTVLKVEFVGWTKAEVRSVLGESGTGWCVLEEVKQDDDDVVSLASSTLSDMSADPEVRDEFSTGGDPTQSFILPTLDFSSSYLAQSPVSAQSPSFMSDISSPSTLSSSFVDSFDSISDFGSNIYSDSPGPDFSLGSSGGFVNPPSTNGWFGFSSDFSRQASIDRGDQGPNMFV